MTKDQKYRRAERVIFPHEKNSAYINSAEEYLYVVGFVNKLFRGEFGVVQLGIPTLIGGMRLQVARPIPLSFMTNRLLVP